MHGYTHTEGLKKASGRSGLSNNHALLPIDGRSTIARRFRDVVRDIVSDQGGIGMVAETRLQLIRRFAASRGLRADGLFLHFCAECGRCGAFGYGVNLRASRLGRWYCAPHRPLG